MKEEKGCSRFIWIVLIGVFVRAGGRLSFRP